MINVLVAFYFGYYLYAILFFALLITSILHHIQYTTITYLLDKVAIFSIVFYGGYLFYKKIQLGIIGIKSNILSLLIVMTFLSTAIMYYYGYLNNCLCFCEDPVKAKLIHSFMHIVGCLGHCCICFL